LPAKRNPPGADRCAKKDGLPVVASLREPVAASILGRPTAADEELFAQPSTITLDRWRCLCHHPSFDRAIRPGSASAPTASDHTLIPGEPDILRGIG
jgi:hypothetical protein